MSMATASPTTLGGATITLNNEGDNGIKTKAQKTSISSLNIAGQTLYQGSAITVGSDVLSLAPSGIMVIGTVSVDTSLSTRTTVRNGTTMVVLNRIPSTIMTTNPTLSQTTPSITISTTISVVPQTPTVDTPPMAATTPAHKPLPTGTRAGIGIAAAAACLGLIAGFLYVFRYRRRSATSAMGGFEKPELATSADLTAEEKEELVKLRSAAAISGRHPDGIQELGGNERFELDARRIYISMTPVELE